VAGFPSVHAPANRCWMLEYIYSLDRRPNGSAPIPIPRHSNTFHAALPGARISAWSLVHACMRSGATGPPVRCAGGHANGGQGVVVVHSVAGIRRVEPGLMTSRPQSSNLCPANRCFGACCTRMPFAGSEPGSGPVAAALAAAVVVVFVFAVVVASRRSPPAHMLRASRRNVIRELHSRHGRVAQGHVRRR
jgi:hypothetical protein